MHSTLMIATDASIQNDYIPFCFRRGIGYPYHLNNALHQAQQVHPHSLFGSRFRCHIGTGLV
jgi:hypothetical protein